MLVDDRPADAVAASIAECERLGLLTRPDRESPHRFHPLVREFLVARLTAEIGDEAVRELHRQRCVHSRGRLARFRLALPSTPRDARRAARVIDAAVPTILAAGGFERAAPFLEAPQARRSDRPQP